MQFEKTIKFDDETIKSPNLMEDLSEKDIKEVGRLVWEGYDRDLRSREKWEKRMNAGMDLAMQVSTEKTFPWHGCSNVIFPLITIATLQFSARAYSNIIQGTDVVRYRLSSEDSTGEETKRAERIGRHMSWQVLEQDRSWEEQHDRLLINLGIVGTAFIKTYWSPRMGHNVSELVLAKDLVLDYFAKSVENCSRKTQVISLYRNEIYERCMTGVFDKNILTADWFNSPPRKQDPDPKRDNRLGQNLPETDQDTPFKFLEQHRFLDLDGDGYAEPYVVTIEESSRSVCRIVARVDDETQIERDDKGKIISIKPTEYYTKYSFIPSPDGGIYDVGFGVLLGPLNEAVNSGINQLLDSGTMQNSIGGFLGRGAKIRGGQYTMAPWEWKRVDSTGDDLRKNMVPFPERQPSPVMFNLLNLLIGYTDRVSGAVDPMVGINPGQNTPAETSRMMVEQGMQVYAVVFKRVWRSMKEEFKKLHQLNSMFLGSKEIYGSNGQEIRREDYKTNPDLVAPVADPNILSTAHRVMQAQAVRAASFQVPGYDKDAVERHYLRSLRVDGIEGLYKGSDKLPPPQDPKVMLEAQKVQLQAGEQKLKHMQFALELAETARLNNAKIANLEAAALKMMQEAGLEQGDQRLRAFDMAIKAMQEQNRQVIELTKAMQTEEGANETATKRGRVPELAAPTGDQGLLGPPEEMEGEPAGPMGEGGLPGGFG